MCCIGGCGRLWDSKRGLCVGLMIFWAGIILVVVSSVKFGTRVGQEVQLWYNVPLCPTTNFTCPPLARGEWSGTSILQKCQQTLVSRDLGPADVCPMSLDFTEAAVQSISYTVTGDMFIPDAKYTTLLMTSVGLDLLDKSYADVRVSMRDGSRQLYSVSARDEAATSRRRLAAPGPGAGPASERSTSTSTSASAATRRHLLKGSSGGGGSGGRSSGGYSGPSYRSRSGGYAYWGAAGVATRGRTRRSRGEAVDTLTVVAVYSRAPVRQHRVSPSVGARADGSTRETAYSATGNCASATGCDVVLAAGLAKTELTSASWTTPEAVETKSYKLTVSAVGDFNMFTNQTDLHTKAHTVAETSVYPSAFVVFATADSSPDDLWGEVGVPIGCVLTLFGCFAATLKWRCCPDSRKCGGRGADYVPVPSTVDAGSAVVPGPAATPVIAAGVPVGGAGAVPAGAAAPAGGQGTASMIRMPWPQFPGMVAGSPGGSATSTDIPHSSPHMVTELQLANNDVTAIRLARFPALRLLTVSNNDLPSLQGASEAQGLLAIAADDNNLTSLHGLANLPQLVWFKATNNDITSLAGASNVPNLRYLCLANNSLKDTAGIQTMAGLSHVDLSSNDIKSLAGMEALTGLAGLDVSQNDLTDADMVMRLAALPNLAFVDVRGNDFSAVDKQRMRDHFAAAKPSLVFMV